jgi:hypothetical protein
MNPNYPSKIYKNMILVKDSPDYYIIIGHTNEYFEASKSVVLQMEPWVYDNSKPWGVKTWGEWSIPDHTKFLKIYRHVNNLNPAQWFIPNRINIDNTKKNNRIVCILSNKLNDTGHKNRVEFVRYVESCNVDLIDIYGIENYHNFKNYKGRTSDKSVLFEYKYILSAENNNEYNYATEKIWEAFIVESLCFYDGCPNLNDYVPHQSYIPVDLSNYKESLNIILNSIKHDIHTFRLDYIKKAKEIVIKKYNALEIIYTSII